MILKLDICHLTNLKSTFFVDVCQNGIPVINRLIYKHCFSYFLLTTCLTLTVTLFTSQISFSYNVWTLSSGRKPTWFWTKNRWATLKKPTKQLNQKKTYKHVKTDTNNAPLECSSSTEIFVYWRIRLMWSKQVTWIKLDFDSVSNFNKILLWWCFFFNSLL